ncbi:MAG: Alkaline phosphatase, partial [Phycisphaerales bacterium]|nr:Alkaline phosphatase [Phycisphaerales bacterium]
RGGAGNDTLRPGFSASNWVEGDGGTDIVDYSNRTKGVEVHLDGMLDSGYSGEHDRIGTDVEIVYGGSGNDIIFGNVGSPGAKNGLYGNGGNDTLIAGNGSDALFGGEGNDLLLARNGVGDYLDGGNGTDAVHIDMGLDKTINVETFLP